MKESVTMRLDTELLEFTDKYAAEHKTTRTQLITDILVVFRKEVEKNG